MNFVQQQFQPNSFPKQSTHNNNNSASVAATLVQIKSVENSPTSKTVSTMTFNSPESPMTKLGGASFTNAARAQLWTLALYNNKNSSFLIREDKDIIFVALDLPNQNVLKNDCNRTRVNSFSPSLRTSLEKLLTCYCKRENITYKQGLHELAAPFILFLESGISLSETYNLFALFIDKFVPSFYNDQDFLSLQCCQKALSLLLKYHDPALYTFLTTNYLTPEIFSTPWFLTLFASKLELNVVYLLWDLYLVEQDPYFIFFLALGLLIENKHIIMSSSIAVVPEILTNLTIESRDQLKQIYKRAKTLKLNTLQSFVRKLEELEIFKRGYPNDKAYKAKIHKSLDYLERLAHVVLSPYELLQALYPVEIDCANPNCSNLPNGSKKDKIDNTPSRKDSFQNLEMSDRRDPFASRFEHDGSFLCTNCVTRSSSSSRFILEKSMGHLSDILKEKGTYQIQDGNQTYHINFVIMDLRASKESGYLPRSHLIDVSRLKPGAINQLIDEFARLRGVSHFILMTSKFDSSSFSLKPEDRQQPDQGNMSSENNLAAQFLAALTKKGFPYLSIVEGGFQKVNQILNKRNIELLRSSPWTPKSFFKVDSIATTEPFYTSGSPKNATSQLDFRGTYNDLPSANSNHSRGYDFPTENTTSPTNSLNRPKTPNPSSGIFSSARQEVQEPTIDPQQRSKSTLKNQRKIEQPLSSKIDFHTPKTDHFHSKLGFSNHSEVIIQTRASTEASPEKFRLKATVSTPAFLANQGLISTVRTISSPGPMQGGFSSPKISKEAMGYEENPIRASREIFSQQKNKMASTRENYHHESSGTGSGMDGSRSPLSISDNQHQKSCRSAITSPAYNTPNQNSPVHHNSQREQMKTMMPQGSQAPISDFSSMVRYQSSLAFSTNFAGLGSGKVQINNFERDQDFTKSAYAHKEVNSIGDYMNDRKYFASSNDGRLGSDRDNKYSGQQQDYKASTFSNRRSDDLTPEQRPSPLLREYKSFERLEDAERKNNSTPNKRSQKSMTITPQMPQKANMVTQNNKSMSGRVQTSNQSDERDSKNGRMDNKHFYGVGSTERAIIMANEMLRRKGEVTPGTTGSGKSEKDREKVKKRDSEAGFSPTKGHYFNPEYQSQYQNGSTAVTESYLASQQQQRSNSSSRRPMINSGSLSAKTLAVTSPRTMLPDDEYHFYNYFQKRSFSLYICEYFQRIGEEEKNNGPAEDSSPEKSILVISQELVITVQFNQNVLQKLVLIQKGVPANQLVQSPQKNGFNPSLVAGQLQRDLGILSVLPLKLLLKVTSKKADPKFISIYFKFPKQEEECFRRYYEMFDQSNMTLEEIFWTAENKEFEHVLDEVRTHKDDKKFTEIKSVYRLENEETAQKCIIKVKEAYKKNPGMF